MGFKYIGRLFGWILLAVNLLLTAIMLFCAYSPYINPATHPVMACTGLAFPIFLLCNLLCLLFWMIIYKRYALLSFIGLLICAPQIFTYIPLNLRTDEKKIPERSIKFLSYNVMAYHHDVKHTEKNPNPVVEYLEKCGADIICLQEAGLYGQKHKTYLDIETVDRAMSAYPYKSHHKSRNNAWDCYSRYPILSVREVEYESEGNGSVMYEIKIEEDTVLVINNHFESNRLSQDDKAVYKDMIIDPEKKKVKSGSKQLISKVASAGAIRSAQADAVAKVIAESPHEYIIVCGDFNDSPISYTHRVVSENLRDAFTESGLGMGISYHRNGFYFRIDHILASDNLQAYNCTVDNSIDASDHYPIWCYLSKREK